MNLITRERTTQRCMAFCSLPNRIPGDSDAAANPDRSLSGRCFAPLSGYSSDNLTRTVTPLCPEFDGSPSDRRRWFFNTLGLEWDAVWLVNKSLTPSLPQSWLKPELAPMAQILDPLPSEYDHRILCGYINTTDQIQIVRIANIPNWYFERVVFPRQRLLFEALPEAQLEIHTGEIPTAMLADKISSVRLRVNDGISSSLDKTEVNSN
jgi:hypothetical protein